MKKLTTLITALFFVSNLLAQNFVSTSPENKNVVLEEFTGIHCVYCPDGHLKAQQLSDANPGDVVLINIHTGSYASPNPGEPDFRSDPEGAGIANQSGVAGYPAGTVNRHLFPGLGQSGANVTAMSRGDWAGAAGQILAQPSCVNVAAEATLDVSTRLLTVNVEAYYTANSTNPTNKLNVVLLQNNVEGPQTGGSSYNPTAILPNGNYNHQHMFRHLLTGQWGDDITSTTTGALFQQTYNYIIPTDLNGVAYDLFNLEVAVFVAEGQQEILSGNMANMTYVVPPGINLIDLSATTNMSMPASLCDNNITPEITVINQSGISVDTFEVSYTLNTGNPVTQAIYTSLAPSASTTITFPMITVPSGENTISYSAATIGGTSFIDNVPNNNLASSGSFNTISPTAFATSHSEGFEGYGNTTPAPNNALLLNPQGYRVFIIDQTWPGPNSGGYGMSNNSFRWQFVQMSGGNYADLVFAKLDFSNSNRHGMSYSYAHAQNNGFDNNRLQILVSTDCGVTWSLESELSGSNLATTAPVGVSSNFYPTANAWETDTVDLSAYDGNAEVMIAFRGICAGGNNLYIDDIEINGGMIISSLSNPSTEDINVNLYPNPTNKIATFELNIEKNMPLEISVVNILGEKVKEIKSDDFTKGIHNITFDTSNLKSGTYFVKYEFNNEVKNVRFVVSR